MVGGTVVGGTVVGGTVVGAGTVISAIGTDVSTAGSVGSAGSSAATIGVAPSGATSSTVLSTNSFHGWKSASPTATAMTSGVPTATTQIQRRRRGPSGAREVKGLRHRRSFRSAGGGELEGDSTAGWLFDPDPAAVGFHEAVGDRQPETGAARGAAAARIGAGEAFEGVR